MTAAPAAVAPTGDPAPTATALKRLGRAADAAAWHWVVETYGERIHRLVARIIGGGPAADDACQEVFLQLRADSRRFRRRPEAPEAAAVGWICRLATTTALGCLRRARRRRRREVPLADLPVTPTAAPEPDPRVGIVAAALAELPERDRLVVHLRFHGGLGAEALAAALGASAGAARVRLHRAVEALRARCARRGLALDAEALGAVLILPGPVAGPAPLAALHALAHRPLPAPGLVGVRGIVAGGAIAVLAVTWRIVAGHGPAAVAPPLPAPVPAPAPAPAAAGLHLTREELLQLRIHVEFSETPLEEMAGFFTRVLRVPVRLAPGEAWADGVPVTLMEDNDAVAQVLDVIGQLGEVSVAPAPIGGWQFTHARTPRMLVPGPGFAALGQPLPHALRLQGDPLAALRQLEQGLGAHPAALDLLAVADRRPIDLPLAAGAQGIIVHQVLSGFPEDVILPQDRLGRKVWHGSWPAMPLAQALARIQQATGLPLRIDDDSGPMPWVARTTTAPIRVQALLQAICQQAHALCTQAADGMVIWRPAHTAWADGDGHARDPQTHQPYQDHHARWWWPTAVFTPDHPLVLRQVPVNARLVDVAWHGAAVAAAGADLARQLGLPLRLDPDAATRRVDLRLPGRTAGEVLWALNHGSACTWTVEDGALHIAALPAAAAGTPGQPPPAVAPPAGDPLPRPAIDPRPAPTDGGVHGAPRTHG